MGNQLACSCSSEMSPTWVRVLNSDTGHVSHYPSTSSSSLQAGEIMMDHPSHYLSRLADLEIGHRIVPIPADHVLESDQPYVLLPMRTLHSKVSQEDLAFLLSSASLLLAGGKSKSKKQSKSRILPLTSPFSLLSSSSPLSSSSSHQCQTQFGPVEEAATPACPSKMEAELCRAPLFRSQSLGIMGEDMVANGEKLQVQALRMRRTMSWMPKLEPIGESESESEQLNNDSSPCRPNSSKECSRMGSCIPGSTKLGMNPKRLSMQPKLLLR